MIDLRPFPEGGVSTAEPIGAYAWIGNENPFMSTWDAKASGDVANWAQVVVVGPMATPEQYLQAVRARSAGSWRIVTVEEMQVHGIEPKNGFQSIVLRKAN